MFAIVPMQRFPGFVVFELEEGENFSVSTGAGIMKDGLGEER